MSDNPQAPSAPEPEPTSSEPELTAPEPTGSKPSGPGPIPPQSSSSEPKTPESPSQHNGPQPNSSQPNASQPDAPAAPPTAPPTIPDAPSTAPGPEAPPLPPTGQFPPTGQARPTGQVTTDRVAQAGAAQPQEKSTKRVGSVGMIAAIAIAALVGGVSGAGVTAVALNNSQNNASVQSSNGATSITVNRPQDANIVTAVAASAAPSVVTISVSGDGVAGTGSGVVLSDDGYILTNAHVATLSGATADPTLQVQTADGHLYDAKLIGSDPIADLAVIKVDAKDVTFQPAEFAKSDNLNVGDTVVALGAPLGLSNTVTTGIVSALNRSITVASSAVPDNADDQAPDNGGNGDGQFDFPFQFPRYDNQPQQKPSASSTIALPVIQTDAAINPGNSGGALLDTDGKVIGINVAIASTGGSNSESVSGNIGVGFAIPAGLAKRVSGELIKNGTASHGLLGASVMDVTDDSDIASSATVGSSIHEVTSGGPADRAGLRKGDVIVQFDGLPITGKTDLTAQVRVLAGGSDADVVYVRNGKTHTATVTLDELTKP